MDTAFFLAATLARSLLKVETWFLICLLGASLALLRGTSVARIRRSVARWLSATLVLLLSVAALPLGVALLRPLEQYIPADPITIPPRGIIILGGAEDSLATQATGLPQLNDAAERITTAITLARLYPDAQIVLTGGAASLDTEAVRGADVMAALLRDAGVSPDRLVIENASRNTGENAAMTAALLGPGKGPWILVTSAFHMPRALGTFCAAGFRTIFPYPVDFRATDAWDLGWDLTGRLDLLNLALKEWTGLLAYRITGRTHVIASRTC